MAVLWKESGGSGGWEKRKRERAVIASVCYG